MKQNKYLEEVWNWKEKLNTELAGLSIKEVSEKINEETAKSVNSLQLRCIRLPEKIQPLK